jgi:methylmalonyl-CoA mutase N-terminal domain/subunit
MWARIMRDRFGAKDPSSLQLRFHAQTAGSTLTAQHVDNNVVRVTLQALSAVLGGAQSLHTNSRDEALALPSEAAAILALRTQQILASESGVADTVDPLGGSWFVERLTDELEEEASALIARIDELGGMVTAIEQGYPQREIQNAAYRAQVDIETRAREVVGVNVHAGGEGEPPDILRIDPALETAQVKRLRAFRAGRDDARVRDALDRLRQAAAGNDNVLPPIVEAVRSGCTLGEIADSMRQVFGEYRESVVI